MNRPALTLPPPPRRVRSFLSGGGVNRRTFIRSSIYATAGGLMTSGCSTAHLPATLPRPCPPEAWHKHGLVLEPTESWEGDAIQNFTCPAEPLGHGAWRIWYSVSDPRLGYGLARAEGIPGKPMKKIFAQCSPGPAIDAPFALGYLPEKWKPVQGIHLRLLDGRHRLYFWAHGPRIVRYLAADSDEGQRFNVVDPLRPLLYHTSDRAAWSVRSPDGLMAHPQPCPDRPLGEPLAIPSLISNDATNVYQMPDGTFEIYSVGLVPVPKGHPAYVAHDNAPGLVRVIDRYTSTDGLHLQTRQRIIEPDALDPVDQQFYYLSVTYTPKGRVGLLGHYRCEAQTMDLEWCFSSDGIKWERPQRKAWLERGAPPAADCYGIYANNHLVPEGGNWHLFYTGVNAAHNGKHTYGKSRQVIMHASTHSIWA